MRKSYNEKLNTPGDLPRVEDMSGNAEFLARYGARSMLIAAPMQYNELIAAIPRGRVVTTEALREDLAKAAGADMTCPLTAGIFINICANAALERGDEDFPYWRVVKARGECNPKFPEGDEGQAQRLAAEGHQVVQRGKKWFVAGWDKA